MQFSQAAFIVGIGLFTLVVGGTHTGYAEPVGNGNELALRYAASTPAERRLIQKDATGTLQTFRYLKVTEITNNAPTSGAITLTTVEPSSDIKVTMVITKNVSLKIARTLAVGDCVAAKGRVKSLGKQANDLIVLSPAILKYKDRSGPKLSKELLHEVDSSAY